jgi:hypothetical protein
MTAREAHLWLGLILASELGNDLLVADLVHVARQPVWPLAPADPYAAQPVGSPKAFAQISQAAGP